MKYLRVFLLLVLFPGCAEMGDFYLPEYYAEEEYYEPAAGSCAGQAVPTYQPAPASQPSPVLQGGYQTKEPPR